MTHRSDPSQRSCVKYLKKKKKNRNDDAARRRAPPAPSSGEFAPAFSASADFDILISAGGKRAKRVRPTQTEAESAETRADHYLDDERGKRVAGVVIGHECSLSAFRLLTGPTCTLIHLFQPAVEHKSRLTEGIDF